MQKARTGELPFEQCDAGILVECAVVVAGARHRKQLGNHTFVGFRVLPQVHRGKIEAENAHRANQRHQALLGQQYGAVGTQRFLDNTQVGQEVLRRFVRQGSADLVAYRLHACQGAQRGGQAGIDADQCAPIRLSLAVFGFVGGCIRHRGQRFRDLDQHGGKRQFAPQLVHFVQVVLDGDTGAARQRVLERVGVYIGVAIAVAANPATYPKDRFHVRQFRRRHRLCHQFLDLAVQARQFAQEGIAEERVPVLDLVDHPQPGQPQHAGLPQRQYPGVECFKKAIALCRRQRHGAQFGNQTRNLELGVENALALHFGGVSGKDGREVGVLEKRAQPFGCHPTINHPFEREFNRTFAWWQARDGVETRSPAGLHVFGDVGQVRKVGEGTHHRYRAIARKPVQHGRQATARVAVVVAPEAHGQLAHGFDNLEGILAFLCLDGFAQNPAEKANVFAQRCVFVGHLPGWCHECECL